MRRREFIALTSCAAAFAPFAARAQQAKTATIGVLVLGSPPPEALYKALRNGLQRLGYSEGRNLTLEIRSAEGRAGRLPELAAELVRLKVDVIVAYQTPPATAAKEATSEIPVVMASVGDPVGTGLVASLARPGGNVTGTTAGSIEIAGKTVELIRELLPAARRFAVLANETDSFTKPYLAEIARVAGIIRIEAEPIMARPGQPLEAAFESMVAKRAEAVVIQGSLVRKEAIDLATKHRLPSLSSPSILPRAGGLMSYSADFDAMIREATIYIDKILKGAKPAELPISFPTKFELIINLKTARALGIDEPPALVARADEVIE
jgi:putative ABC transport system substrate-binding protein